VDKLLFFYIYIIIVVAVKHSVVGCWCGYVSGSRCRFAYGPADATAIHSLALVNPDWFYLSGAGSLGRPGQDPRGP